MRAKFEGRSEVTRNTVELVKQIMEAKNITRSDVARSMNVSRSYMTHLLDHQVDISVRQLERLVHAIGGKIDIQITFEKGETE